MTWHLQYIGEVDKTNIKCNPTTVIEHFRSHNHRYIDMQLIPLELIHSSRDSKTQSFFYRFSGNLGTHGLNRRDELYWNYVG